jgi:hypothetical protein
MGTWGRSSLCCMHAIESSRTHRGAGASYNRLIAFVGLDPDVEGRLGRLLDDHRAERRDHRLDLAAVEGRLAGELIGGAVPVMRDRHLIPV